MAEERLVFDFTDEEFWDWRNFSDDDHECWLHNEYRRLINDSINNYQVLTTDNKAIVTFTTRKDEQYDCIYFIKTQSDIEDLIVNGEDLDLKYCYINGFDITKIETNKDYELYNLDARYSFWDKKVNFKSAKFGKNKANFRGARFIAKEVSFYNVSFNEIEVDFSYTYFYRCFINFQDAKFKSNKIIFDSSFFEEGKANFWEVNFGNGEVWFVAITCKDFKLSFSECEFGDGHIAIGIVQYGNAAVVLDGSRFGKGEKYFSGTNLGEGIITFSGTDFGEGDVDFNRTKFGNGNIYFGRTKFSGGKVDFSNAIFGEGDVDFENVVANRFILSENKFSSFLDLRFETVNELIIKDCITEKTVKISGTPSILSLKNTINLGQIHFSDEPKVIVSAIENSFKEDEELTDKQKLDQLTLIKENYHQLGEYDGEDLAYQTYMKYKTKFMKKGIKKFFYWLFSKIGKYGTAPGNIIAWAGGVAVFLGLIYWPFMANQTNSAITIDIFKGLYFSLITFLTIGYGDIAPPNTGIAFLAGFEGFLGLFFMAYFTVAVVRKLLR